MDHHLAKRKQGLVAFLFACLALIVAAPAAAVNGDALIAVNMVPKNAVANAGLGWRLAQQSPALLAQADEVAQGAGAEIDDAGDEDDGWGDGDEDDAWGDGDEDSDAQEWDKAGEVYDPWEKWNRKMFAFNEFGDKFLVKPVSIAYDFITPAPIDIGITNAYQNIREPITIINGVLQGKWRQAGSDTGRLLINSTLGLVGLFDVASKLGLERHVEDFGQTLGHWGVKPGPYVVLPLLGPSGLRDGLGLIPDAFSNPLSYIGDFPTRAGVNVGYYVDIRADLLDTEELITGDRYVFLRDTYLQNREYLVEDGEVEDDFGEEDF